jgi:hypothetical protein
MKISSIVTTNKEVWIDVKGYEGLYQVSNFGRVKSLDRYRVDKNGVKYKFKGGIKKQSFTRGDYLFVSLYKENKPWLVRVNRLVALNFIENPLDLPQVGHWNDDKQNNSVSNLYWTDAKENSTHNDRHIKTGEKIGKPIIGKKGNKVIKFNSSLEAARKGFNASAIRNCLIGLSNTHKGYTWERI